MRCLLLEWHCLLRYQRMCTCAQMLCIRLTDGWALCRLAGLYTVRAVKSFAATRSHRRRMAAWMAASETQYCAGFHETDPSAAACRSCSGETACSHVFPVDTADASANPFVCVLCGHFKMHEAACAHYYPTAGAACMFCHRSSTSSERDHGLALMSLSEAALAESRAQHVRSELVLSNPLRLPSTPSTTDLGSTAHASTADTCSSDETSASGSLDEEGLDCAAHCACEA